jgi:hypothetical protein
MYTNYRCLFIYCGDAEKSCSLIYINTLPVYVCMNMAVYIAVGVGGGGGEGVRMNITDITA